MAIKIYHTGDNHIGMSFNNYPSVKKDLIKARFLTLENMIFQANEEKADIFVIAGDLFHSIDVPIKDIEKTVNILNKFKGACVLVLPGNHDYDSNKTKLWQDFQKSGSEKIIILNEFKPYNLSEYNLDVTIYPAHCHSLHSSDNNLGWIKESGLKDKSKYNIGVAHGAIEGLSADLVGKYFYMEKQELIDIPVDLWLLGHTHVAYPVSEKVFNHKIFNAGAPEADGLDFGGKGSAWIIELSEDRSVAHKIETGMYEFFDKSFNVSSREDLEKIKAWALSDNPKLKLVRIDLSGSLSEGVYLTLSDFYENLEKELFYLIVIDENLKIKVDMETISQQFSQGSFPYEFLLSLADDEEALQVAYDIVRRS
ncbi:MAG TPA: DNA repair exonuclease [Erysipelotrichaceae bacterium]|nr:DNA repair exonuclease [Erysipelotrichaceae bacterium]